LLHKLTSPLDLSAYVPSFPNKSHAKLKGPTAVLCAYAQARHVRRRQGYPSTLPDFPRKSIIRFESLAPAGVAPWPRGLQLEPHSCLPCKNAGLLWRPPISFTIHPRPFQAGAKEGGALRYERHACRKSLHIVRTRTGTRASSARLVLSHGNHEFFSFTYRAVCGIFFLPYNPTMQVDRCQCFKFHIFGSTRRMGDQLTV